MMDRRSFIQGSTVAAIGVGAASQASADEQQLLRLHQLYEEASELMRHWNSHMGGRWELRVRACGDAVPVSFVNLDGDAA